LIVIIVVVVVIIMGAQHRCDGRGSGTLMRHFLLLLLHPSLAILTLTRGMKPSALEAGLVAARRPTAAL
jgi:hypothetical protein